MSLSAILTSLAALALVEAGFAGFRASCGRSGLVLRVDADRRAALRGLTVLCVLELPTIAILVATTVLGVLDPTALVVGCQAMLWAYLPFAGIVVLGLLAYSTLTWRYRFLAVALLLGPITMLRPLVAAAGVFVGAAAAGSTVVTALQVLGVGAALLVEPITGQIWYRPQTSVKRAVR